MSVTGDEIESSPAMHFPNRIGAVSLRVLRALADGDLLLAARRGSGMLLRMQTDALNRAGGEPCGNFFSGHLAHQTQKRLNCTHASYHIIANGRHIRVHDVPAILVHAAIQ